MGTMPKTTIEIEEGKVKVVVAMTPVEFRDKILVKIPTRGKETLADVFDMLVKSLVETAGLTKKEGQAFVAPEFWKVLHPEGS